MDTWLCWCRDRIGLPDDEFRAALARMDAGGRIGVGGMPEAEYWRGWTAAFALTPPQTDEIAAGSGTGTAASRTTSSWRTRRRCARCGVAILSNSAPGAREQEEARYGYAATFDPIVYSHEVGVAKPDPRIYALTCERLGVRPD